MTIEKLPSGSYRIRQMDKGKLYLVTVDHKPSKAEATRLMADRMAKTTATPNKTLKSACESYIADRENIISPATIMGYTNLIKGIPTQYAEMYLMDITNSSLQAIANSFSKDHAVKTTKNLVSFIMSVLKYNDIMIKPPTLPQMKKKVHYIPTKEDIAAIFKELKGTEFEVPIALAALGLRRSEICALTIDDLKGNVLSVNKAKVPDKNGNWVIKSTKTVASIRTIVIPDDLADLIRKQGYVYNGFPGYLYEVLHKVQKKLGIPLFPLHKYRHFFCSYMHDQGFSDKAIQEMGGWSSSSQVMNMIYKHGMDMEQVKSDMANSINSLR